jgi:ubiquinone/menaquinone biosynthesis C-methylase UbiE
MAPEESPALSLLMTPVATAPPAVPPVPRYLLRAYWWAYVHPRAVRVFEREWLVNLILFGNYGRLRDAALSALGGRLGGRTLQVACAYGNLTARLHRRLAPEATLDVVDVLAVQLKNLARKLPPDERVSLVQADATALPGARAEYDQVLLFFLLHEQPEAARRATLAEAVRVVKPGGRIVIVDYHRPGRWHPMRPLVRLVFRWLEPFAIDLWRREIADFLPAQDASPAMLKTLFFFGLYQLLVLTP